MHSSILFLTLRVFSAIGGIEKVCRILGKALYENALQTGGEIKIVSLYDNGTDSKGNPYFPSEIFEGYAVRKIRFSANMIVEGKSFETVILSHVNLLPIGYMIKKLNKNVRIILLAHGIEIWDPLPGHNKKMLAACDLFLAVSQFTANKLKESHHIKANKIEVLNNCLDPFLEKLNNKLKPHYLLKRYGFEDNDIVLMTLARLQNNERYKGYDKVILALANSELKQRPNVKYLLAGAYDELEYAHICRLANSNQLGERVVVPGFICEEELVDHFRLSDIYIMPSKKEGFGIVFVEAMHFGLPVIAGNKDGSTDALMDGKLGQLVDPDNELEIKDAICRLLDTGHIHNKINQEVLSENFGYETYKERLEKILNEEEVLN